MRILEPHRWEITFHSAGPVPFRPRAFVPVFHEWIQNDRLEGELLIDVADYDHLRDRPCVLLVGHETTYRVEQADGRVGLRCTSKLYRGNVAARFRSCLHSAVRAGLLLEEALPPLRFLGNELLLGIPDRLRAPRRPGELEALEGEVRGVLAPIVREGARIRTSPASEGKEAFALRVAIGADLELETLRAGLGLDDGLSGSGEPPLLI